MNSKIIKLINDYWRFDNDQDSLSTWHDKNDLIKEIEALTFCRSFKIQGSNKYGDWEQIVLAENKEEALNKCKNKCKDSTDIKLVRDYGKPLF